MNETKKYEIAAQLNDSLANLYYVLRIDAAARTEHSGGDVHREAIATQLRVADTAISDAELLIGMRDLHTAITDRQQTAMTALQIAQDLLS